MNSEEIQRVIDEYTQKLAQNAKVEDVNWNEYLRWLREEIQALQAMLAEAEAEKAYTDWIIRRGQT